MSVIVKGGEMPQACMYCPMFNGMGCKATMKMFNEQTNIAVRVQGCPLVALPEKHGRLISAKRIEFELCESNMPKQYRDFCRRVLNDENLTPTVLESEE